MSPGPGREIETARLLLEAARYLGETLDRKRVYERFRELMAEAISCDGVVVSSFDPTDEMIRCEYAWVDGELLDPSILPPLRLNRRGGMQSEVIRTGRPLLTNDVRGRVQDDGTYYDVDSEGTMRKVPDEGPPRTQAAMMVPVKDEGRVVGVVQLMSDHVTYDEQQLELAEGIVAQMGAAVRNARLHEERIQLAREAAVARTVAAERQRAAQVLEAVGDGVVFVGHDGIVGFWNRAAELITGVGGGTLLGRPIGELSPQWESIVGSVRPAEPGERPRPTTLPFELGGQELWLSFTAVRAMDGIVYAFRDLTPERQLEQSKDEIIATVSHELRTPMTAVLGAANTLLRSDLELGEHTRRELLEMISAQATRLAHVTETVLLAGRLDRGEVIVEPKLVDVEEVVRQTVSTLASTLPGSVTIEQEFNAAGQASGDHDGLQQVLLNLLDNAVKYSGDHATVVVSTSRAGERVRIDVSDDGPGIPPGEADRVFEKFYRSSHSLREAPSGTGLGLYICRELMRRMGGGISVASTAGTGSSFSIDLPAGS